MARYGVTPNIMVLCPEMQLYVTMVPQEKVAYYEAGQNGVSRFEGYDGRLDIPVGNIRGLQCYVSNPFEDNEAGRPTQMLRRQTQIGEFYVMSPPQVLGPKALPGTYMDILIYDEREDRLKTITFREAVLHAVPWIVNKANTDAFNVVETSKARRGDIRVRHQAVEERCRQPAKTRTPPRQGQGKLLLHVTSAKVTEQTSAAEFACLTRP